VGSPPPIHISGYATAYMPAKISTHSAHCTVNLHVKFDYAVGDYKQEHSIVRAQNNIKLRRRTNNFPTVSLD